MFCVLVEVDKMCMCCKCLSKEIKYHDSSCEHKYKYIVYNLFYRNASCIVEQDHSKVFSRKY